LPHRLSLRSRNSGPFHYDLRLGFSPWPWVEARATCAAGGRLHTACGRWSGYSHLEPTPSGTDFVTVKAHSVLDTSSRMGRLFCTASMPKVWIFRLHASRSTWRTCGSLRSNHISGIYRVDSEEQLNSNPDTQNLCWVNWKSSVSRMAMKLLIWPGGKMSSCSSGSRVQMNQWHACRSSFPRPLALC
jgi:hypothetical protein